MGWGAWWSSGLTRYVEAMPRVEGSKQAVYSSFSSRTYLQQTGAKKSGSVWNRWSILARRKVGAAKAGAATTIRFESGMVTRKEKEGSTKKAR